MGVRKSDVVDDVERIQNSLEEAVGEVKLALGFGFGFRWHCQYMRGVLPCTCCVQCLRGLLLRNFGAIDYCYYSAVPPMLRWHCYGAALCAAVA